MTKKLKTLILLPAICAGIALPAQDKKALTLDSAISKSLQHSGQVRLSKARIEEADALLKQAEQRKLPDASVSGSYVHLSSANVDLKTQNSSGGSSAPPKISQAMYGILNASLPIYAGGRINYGIEAAQLLEKAAKLDAENDKAEVIQTTIEAFVNLYKTRQAVALVQANLSQAQQRVKDLTNLEKNGLIARNDLLRAQLQSSNTELALLDAENSKTLSNTALVLLLGLPDQTEVIPDSTVFNTSIELKSLDEFLQNAKNARNDRAALDLKKKAAETGILSAKGEYYPNLSLTGGYIAANIPKFVTITNAVNIGIGVNYSISS
jgi:outer membrane protein